MITIKELVRKIGAYPIRVLVAWQIVAIMTTIAMFYGIRALGASYRDAAIGITIVNLIVVTVVAMTHNTLVSPTYVTIVTVMSAFISAAVATTGITIANANAITNTVVVLLVFAVLDLISVVLFVPRDLKVQRTHVLGVLTLGAASIVTGMGIPPVPWGMSLAVAGVLGLGVMAVKYSVGTTTACINEIHTS